MCVQADALPDDCLLAIFDRVPLAELIHFDQVCPLWAVLLPLACARRRKLTLILDWSLDRLDQLNPSFPPSDNLVTPIDGGLPYYDLLESERVASLTMPNLLPDTCHDDPKVANCTELSRLRGALFSGQLATYLTALFPKVNTLVVIHTKCFENELRTLVGLVGSSSWALVTLKMWLVTNDMDERYANRPDQHPVGTLLGSINSQRSSLRELTLEVNEEVPLGNQVRHEFSFPIESFAFIAQLKVAKIYLQYYDSHNSIWDIVHRYDNANLLQIGLGSSYTLQAGLNPQFEFVTTKLRQLFWHDWFATVELLGRVCLRFSSLTMLQIHWSHIIPFTELVVHLASLRQLAHLVIFLNFEGHRHPANPFALVDRVDGVGEQEPRPISLPQVRILEMFIRKRDHFDLESFSPFVFPSVEMVILKNLRFEDKPEAECAICRPNATGEHDTQVAKKCFQWMGRSLRNKFTNPMVRIYADGACVTQATVSPQYSMVAILVGFFVGLTFLFGKMQLSTF